MRLRRDRPTRPTGSRQPTAAGPLDLGSVDLGPRVAAAPADVPATSPDASRWSGPLPQGDLRCEGISVQRGAVRILTDVSARGVAGRPLALTGPSGSGKSTLLSVLGGLTAANAGTVHFEDREVTVGTPALRREIGVVLQGYGLVNLLTVTENVEVGLRILGRTPDEAAALTGVALERVQLADRGDHLIEDLSGGQQQRVALARVLAAQPPAVLADEPTAELDHETRDLVLELLLDYAHSGRILIIATHDPDVAALCDDHVRLVDGRRC